MKKEDLKKLWMSSEEIHLAYAEDLEKLENKIDLSEKLNFLLKLQAKLLKIRDNQKTVLLFLNKDFDVLEKNKFKFYSGQGTDEDYKKTSFNLKLNTSKSIQKWVDSDEEVLKLKTLIAQTDINIDTVEQMVKTINSCIYNYSAIVNAARFNAGL